MRFDHYEDVPQHLAQGLIEAMRKEHAHAHAHAHA
jgi:hypothetical protein